MPDSTEVEWAIDWEMKDVIKWSIEWTATIAEVEKTAAKKVTHRTIRNIKWDKYTDNQIKKLLKERLFDIPAVKELHSDAQKRALINNMTDIIQLFKDSDSYNWIAEALSEWIWVMMVSKPVIDLASSDYYQIMWDVIANVIYKWAPETQTAIFAKMQQIMESAINNQKWLVNKTNAKEYVKRLYFQLEDVQQLLKDGMAEWLPNIPAVKADRIWLIKKVLDWMQFSNDYEEWAKLITKEKKKRIKEIQKYREEHNLAELTDDWIDELADIMAVQQMEQYKIYSKTFYDNFYEWIKKAFKEIRDERDLTDKSFELHWLEKSENWNILWYFNQKNPVFGVMAMSTLLWHLKNTDIWYTAITHEFRHRQILEWRLKSLRDFMGKENMSNVNNIAAAETVDLSKHKWSFYAYILTLENMLKEDVKKLKWIKKEWLSYADVMNLHYTGKLDDKKIFNLVEERYWTDWILDRLKKIYEWWWNTQEFLQYSNVVTDDIEELINEMTWLAEAWKAWIRTNNIWIHKALDTLKKAWVMIDRFRIMTAANQKPTREELEKQLLSKYDTRDIIKAPSVYENISKTLRLFWGKDTDLKKAVSDFQKIINQANIEVTPNTTTEEIKKQVLWNLEHHRFDSKDTEKLQKLIDWIKWMDWDEVVVLLDAFNATNYTPYQFLKSKTPEREETNVVDNVWREREKWLWWIKWKWSILNYEWLQFTKMTDWEASINDVPSSRHFEKTDKLMKLLTDNQKMTKNVPLISAIKSMWLETNTIWQQYIKLLSDYIWNENRSIDIRKILVWDKVLEKYLEYFNNWWVKDFNTFCLNRLAANILSINWDYKQWSNVLAEMSEKAKAWQIRTSVNNPPTREILNKIIDTRFEWLDVVAETKKV